MKISNKLIFGSIVFQLFISTIHAQSGTLDLSFDDDGRVVTSIGTFEDVARAVKVQNDGKIVVAGFSYGASDFDFVLARYNPNGSIDPSFGTNGIVTTAIQSADDKAYCLAIQDDGKIIAAGYSYGGTKDWVAIARYNTDGSLDQSFNQTGMVTTFLGINTDYANAIALQDDGKIVLTGGTMNENTFNLFAIRYNADGTLDSSFDGDGIAIIDLAPNQNDAGNDIVIQDDGKIVIAGYTNTSNQTDFALVRLNSNGSLDNTFDTDGIVSHGIVGTFNENANALALQNDGKLVVAGSSNNTFYDFIITRYNTDGSFDNGFGADGITVTDLGTSTDFGAPLDLVIQNDNKIVAAGYQNMGIHLNFSVIRYNADGNIDNSFGANGIVTTDFNGTGDDQGLAVALQNDEKILVAGTNYDNQGKIAIARYNNTLVTEITEVNDLDYEEIIISPNPSQNIARIKAKSTLRNAQMHIVDNNGQLVKQFEKINGNSVTIDIHDLPTGIYFVRILEENKNFETHKMVISN